LPESLNLRKDQVAVIDIRVLPWRPRQRRMNPALMRENASEVLNVADDPSSLLLSIGVWIAIVVAAPALVVLLAVSLFPVELLAALILAIAILLIRFAGIVPWTVRVTDHAGIVNNESHRSLRSAIRRVRTVNADRRIPVTLSWT
jgi:hypothetical protein